ncbi:TPA: hypothetical protein ACTW6W_005032, partial [Raoultella ornithinolytica]
MQIDDGMRYYSANFNVVESLTLDRLTFSRDKRPSHQFRELSAPIISNKHRISLLRPLGHIDDSIAVAGFNYTRIGTKATQTGNADPALDIVS